MDSTLLAVLYFRSTKRTEMQEILYKYFVEHKELNVPGIGTFLLNRTPAVSDFPNKLIYPPSYNITLQASAISPSKDFFAWLSNALYTSEREAVITFNDFAYDIKKQINDGSKITWNGIGVLSSGLGSEVRFEPAFKNKIFEAPVKAEKVIRENASHLVRVGEQEKTSEEMTELLSRSETSRNYWWLAATILIILSLIFIAWYLSSKGVSTNSVGLQQPIEAPVTGNTYYMLP